MKKKLIAILIVLALVSTGVFAANAGDAASALFKIQTQIEGLSLVSLTKGEISAQTVGAWNNAHGEENNLAGKTISIDDYTVTDPYVNILNNTKNGVYLRVSAEKMGSADNANLYTIGYTLTVNSKSHTAGSGTPTEIYKPAETAASNGVIKIISSKIDLDVTGDLDSAPEDTYTGTITFTISAS
jgi:hypothetical protein